jgi:hypothetical protein
MTKVEPAAMVCDWGWKEIAGAPFAWTASTPPLLVTDPPEFVAVTVYEPTLAEVAELIV